jgi:hypothetical protein
MKMSGPGEYRTPNTTPMIHTPVIPRAVTEKEYRTILLDMLRSVHALFGSGDPAYSYCIAQLEDAVIATGMTLPIVRRAENEQASE